jgi:GT2 family glycosyltransferase
LAETDYGRWLSSSETSEQELAAMAQQIAGLRYKPLVSIALVISDQDEVWIRDCVDSVLQQVYPHLELCICDNGSGRRHVLEVLEEYEAAGHAKVRRLPEKRSWAGAYNEALSMTNGEFVALLDGGDEIAPEAIFKVVELLQDVRADVVYTDEDHIDVGGRRSDPVFKPYWSPDLLMSTPYVGRLCVVRRSILGVAGRFREGFRGVEEQDLALRLSEVTERIYHLPEVLYHRRRLLTASGEPQKRWVSPRAIEDALARQGAAATVEPGMTRGSYRVVRSVKGLPKVSVVLHAPEGWTNWSLGDRLAEQTAYPVHQIIEARVGRAGPSSAARVSHPFPARALNLAAGEAEGEYLVFMDVRAQPTDTGWLSELLGQAQRQEVGAVGCRLLDPSGGMRHGGSLVEINQLTGDPREEMKRLIGNPRERALEGGEYLPLTDYAFNYEATSMECMMVRRASFERVEGFDDANLPNALYDLDLSFRLRELGLLNVYTPYTQAVCRGFRNLPWVEETEYVWNRWWDKLVQILHYQTSPVYLAYHGLDE